MSQQGWLPEPFHERSFSASSAVAMAIVACLGAAFAFPLPLIFGLIVGGVALCVRRPALFILAVGLLTSSLGSTAAAGMTVTDFGPRSGVATIRSDPETHFEMTQSIVSLDGQLVLAEASGSAGETIAVRLAGETLQLEGRLARLRPAQRWLQTRHVVARLRVDSARRNSDGTPGWRAANHLRRVLMDGTSSMSDDQRVLYAGLLLGDDRGQSAAMTDDFRGSGLSHLLAVSGQNVAFMLSVVGPLLRRLSLRQRAIASLALLTGFAILTRAEPSVLRAVAMAGCAVWAAERGRPTRSIHILALAVTGCVVADPFLIRSVGFQLSVASTAGLVLLSGPIAKRLPVAPILRLPLAVTLSAQLAVAPLSVAYFDGIPLSSVPANLLAEPAAGFAMTWGLPGGLIAGLFGSKVAWLAHLPTRAALTWTQLVAQRSANLPLGRLSAGHFVVLAVLALLAVTVHLVRFHPRRWMRPLTVAAVLTIAWPVASLALPAEEFQPNPTLRLWRTHDSTILVIERGATEKSVLEGMRLGGVRTVSLLVLPKGANSSALAAAAAHRASIRSVWWGGRSPASERQVGSFVVSLSESSIAIVRAGHDPPR